MISKFICIPPVLDIKTASKDKAINFAFPAK